MTRAEAMRALALSHLTALLDKAKKTAGARSHVQVDGFCGIAVDAGNLGFCKRSNQCWAQTRAALEATQPPGVSSKNGRSIAWLDRKMDDDLVVKGLNQSALTFLLQAVYSTKEVDTDRVDHGFRIERVVKNLTDPTRLGTSNAPLKLGDQLLITFRVYSRKLQNYVALEDSLPAGLEIVNPDLALVGKFFQLPPADRRSFELSYSEMRDRSASVADVFNPGRAPIQFWRAQQRRGTFRWPATQVEPR
jgi:uncharacterized protein YfaS (alpha-2-macroglobulin family)